MSDLKDQDPDYGPSVVDNERHRRIYEENARSTTARKIMGIVEREFSLEVSNKEKEVLEIQERLHGALKTLHLLRYVIIADFYNRKQCQAPAVQPGEQKQTQIHPAIRRLIGKTPSNYDSTVPSTSNGATCYSSRSSSLSSLSDSSNDCEKMGKSNEDGGIEKRKITDGLDTDVPQGPPRKMPRYVPPRSTTTTPTSPSRGTRHKCRLRVIVGNISKWIPSEWREDAASHKWTMYVRGSREDPSLEEFVSKVRFFLHPSYRPNDVVEVTNSPFCLSRRGWGEFPLRVQLHFRSALNKPMDIIHHLKLDRTYTGLQTLGAETLVDIWIYAEDKVTKRLQELRGGDGEVQTTKEKEEDGCKNVTSRNDEGKDVEVKVKIEKDLDLDRTLVGRYESDDVVSRTDNRTWEDRCLSTDVKMGDVKALKNENIENRVSEGDEMEIGAKTMFQRKIHERIARNPNEGDRTSIEKGETENRTIVEAEVEVKIQMNVKELEKFILDEVKMDEDSMGTETQVERTRYNVGLDHDYLAARIKEEPLENPATEITTTDSIQSKNESDLVHPLGAASNIHRQLSPSKFRSSLRPLKISIPPAFESTMSKRVLLVQNNKTIPIDVPMCKSDLKHRTSTIAPGSSLLKPRTPLIDQETDVRRLKPGLILNVNYDVPALKIVETRLFPESKPEDRQNRLKITLGKDKHKLQSNKEHYEEILRSIESVGISDVRGLIGFTIRRLPMITKDAHDPEYRRLHPYASKSLEEYFGHSLAKRRALECSRAKLAWNLLKEKQQDLWTVKEIIVWARIHGHTPLCPSNLVKPVTNEATKNLSDTSRNFSTCSEPLALQSWLRNCPEGVEKNVAKLKKEENIEIVEVEENRSIQNALDGDEGTLKDGEGDSGSSEVTVLELEGRLVPLHDFVCETAREIGVQLKPEEIAPRVFHCAAGRMITKAVECFVDELARMALAKAWERYNDTGHPKLVSVEDVRRAISSREEFDIFTNEGLGTKHHATAMD